MKKVKKISVFHAWKTGHTLETVKDRAMLLLISNRK